MKILLDIHVTVTFLRAFQPSAGLSYWKIGTRQMCMKWLLIIRHVNSVNSYSAVLPPSPMVFFIGLWVQFLDQILGREPESQNTCLLTFVFLPWADNGTNLLANKVVQKNSTEISTLICICIGCFTLVRKVYIFNSPSNSDSAILSNHIIWSIKKWLKINRKGTIKGGGAGSDA